MFVEACKLPPMSTTRILPSGQEVILPDLPPHRHVGSCACIKTCGYVRVSDVAGRSGETFVSPEIQVKEIHPWCEHNNRRLVHVVYDIDESGQDFENRIGSIDGMAAGVSDRNWQTIAVWKWARWSRDSVEGQLQVRRIERLGGEVRSATEDMDPDARQSYFMRGLHLLMAEDRGREIGENWKNVHKSRRTKGLPHSGRPRFGYQYRAVDGKDIEAWPNVFNEKEHLGRVRYVPEPETSEILAEAYRNYVRGKSLRSTATDWNAAGIRTTQGHRWSPQSLGKMLDTGFAAGLIRFRTNPPKKAPANRLASYDGWVTGKQPAVITNDEWQAYRARREAQALLPPRSRSAPHSVSALLFCGLCGCRLSTKYQGRNRTHQWTCQSRAARHPETHVGVSNEMILEFLRDWLAARGPENFAGRVAAEAERLARQDRSIVDIDRIRKEVEEIDKVSIPNLIRLQMRNKISEQQFDDMKAEEEERARVLRADLRAAEASKAESSGELDLMINDLASNWALYRSDPEGHRELLSTVVSGIVLTPGKGKLELPSRVKVFPAWEESVFKSAIAALRAAS